MSTPPEPTPPVASPEIPPKPFRVSWWLVAPAILIAVIYIGGTILKFSSAAPQSAAAVANVNPAGPTDVDGFLHMGGANFALILRKKQQLAEEMRLAGIEDEATLKEIVDSLPLCDPAERQKLNGRNYVAVNQKSGQQIQFACANDNTWHPLKALQQIDPATPAQKKAMRSGPRKPDRSKEEAALDAALKSSSVVDFLPSADSRTTNASLSSGTPLLPEGGSQHAAAEKDPAKPDNAYSTAAGPMYRIFEDDVIETLLVNRINGEQSGPVVVSVTTNVYSHDNQVLLIPKGTRILGEASRVSANGQRRLAIVFHRMIMPDGYSKNMTPTQALDQQGEAGLTGRVNTHWAKVLGSAVLVGALGGLSNIGGYGNGGFNTIDEMRIGVTQSSGQSAMRILDRGLNVLPSVEVIEGSRVKILVKEDFLLPANSNHTVSPTL
jgi:type IV secretory pathway VirB10-like protein